MSDEYKESESKINETSLPSTTSSSEGGNQGGAVSSSTTSLSQPMETRRGPGRPRKYPYSSPAVPTSSSSKQVHFDPSPTPPNTPTMYHTKELEKLLLKQKIKKYTKKYFEKEQQRYLQQLAHQNAAASHYNGQDEADYDDENAEEEDDDHDDYSQKENRDPVQHFNVEKGSKLAQILGMR